MNFVVNNELTEGRGLRHCLLRLQNRISALRETYYSLQLENIDLEEMQDKLLKEENSFEKRRLEIKIEQKQANKTQTEKLIEDCLEEIKDLYCVFKQLPKYTREEFEAEEEKHYLMKLSRDIALGSNGAYLSLDAMNKLDNVIKNPKAIDDLRSEKLKLEAKPNVDNIQ